MKMINMSNNICHGQCATSRCYELVERLIKAFSILSGIQQLGGLTPGFADGHFSNKDIKNQIEEGEVDIEILVRDIAKALTGKKIKFLEPKAKE